MEKTGDNGEGAWGLLGGLKEEETKRESKHKLQRSATLTENASQNI